MLKPVAVAPPYILPAIQEHTAVGTEGLGQASCRASSEHVQEQQENNTQKQGHVQGQLVSLRMREGG